MVYPSMSSELQESILRELASQIIVTRGVSEDVETLIRTPRKLYAYAIKTPINWRKIATALNQDRNRIYHWYRETHSRNILDVKMTNEDREAIRSIIIGGIRDRRAIDAEFYKEIHKRFSAKYPRQELRMTYNNALRTHSVRAVLEECGVKISSRRPYRPRAQRKKADKPKAPEANTPVEVSQLSSQHSSQHSSQISSQLSPCPIEYVPGGIVSLPDPTLLPLMPNQSFINPPSPAAPHGYVPMSYPPPPASFFSQAPFTYVPFILTAPRAGGCVSPAPQMYTTINANMS